MKSYLITVRDYLCQAFDIRDDVAVTYRPDLRSRPWHVMDITPHPTGALYLRYRTFRGDGRQAAGFCPIGLDAQLIVTPLTAVTRDLAQYFDRNLSPLEQVAVDAIEAEMAELLKWGDDA